MKLYKRKGTDYTGEKFGIWTVVRFDRVEGKRANYWLCKCKCGNELSCQISRVKQKPNFCNRCQYKNANWKHGLSRSPTYRSWCGLKERCHNSDFAQYADYGGRGIKVCGFINRSVENLIGLIGTRPQGRELSIDRIKNDLHYSCGVCRECIENGWIFNIRWATPKQQARNRRNSVFLTIHGETKTAAEWAEETTIDPDTIYERIKRGWSGERIISPVP